MATLDSLQRQLDSLTDIVDGLSQTVGRNTTTINNHGVLLNQHSNQLSHQEQTLTDHTRTLENHEDRLQALERSKLEVTLIRSVKAPYLNPNGTIDVYMPDDLTLEDFEEYNENVNIAINFNWFRKISNSVGRGKVCFDFDREKGIKSILLGQDTRVLIPLGFKITNLIPLKSTLKVVNEYNMIVNKGLTFGIEIINNNQEEVVVSICNYTNNTVHINRGEVLCSLAHVFRYLTTPEVTLSNLGEEK